MIDALEPNNSLNCNAAVMAVNCWISKITYYTNVSQSATMEYNTDTVV